MKKLLFLILMGLLPPLTAAETTWELGKNFTFGEVWIEDGCLILGAGCLNATPVTAGSLLATLQEYNISLIEFDVNETARIEIENGTFNVTDNETYTLYDNDSSALNTTTAADSKINFSMAAGQGYYINSTEPSQTPPPTSPPASGGGGGGGSPSVTAFESRRTVVDNETMVNVIKELKLEDKRFCRVDRGAAAVFAVTGVKTGDYPAPEADVSKVLKNDVEDVSGDVYETAASEVLKAWSTSDTVVIARGDIEVDSMAGIAYAKARDVPILLTKPGELPSETMDAVKELNAESFVVIGGEKAVDSKVADELADLGSVERIAGEDRQETAAEVAKAVAELTDIDTIVIADGEKPSMDAAVIAAGYDAPVLYVGSNVVPQSTKDFVNAHRFTKRGKEVKLVFADVSNYIATYRLDKDF